MRTKLSLFFWIMLLTVGRVGAVDFARFGDMCDPTPTQSCPNRPAEVAALQKALNSDPSLYLYIKEDGRWTPGTKAAVMVFQEHYGITPASGYVGPKSRMILQKIANATRRSTAQPSASAPARTPARTARRSKLPDAPPTKEFVLYGDMCDNHIQGNHCPNNEIEVSNLQILLNADPNLRINIAADGRWGQGTQKAVVAFQKYYGISPASGYVGARTKRMLDRVAGAMVAQAAPKRTPKRTARSGTTPIAQWHNMCQQTETDTCPNRPEDVRALQRFLNRTLHLKLAVDGKWGQGTQQAVIRFQQQNNIAPASGYVGSKTRRIMQQVARKKHTKARPHPIRTYADFRKYTRYPQTYRIYKNPKLLARANGRNTRIKIDVRQQRMKMYIGGKVALDSPCTTGARRKLEPNTRTIRNKATPKGTFRITEKLADKRSTIFGDLYRNGKRIYHGDRRKYKGSWEGVTFVGASLKNWMRLTDSGIGLHGSRYIKRHPASNGCVRLPYKVASMVFAKVQPGTPVTIGN